MAPVAITAPPLEVKLARTGISRVGTASIGTGRKLFYFSGQSGDAMSDFPAARESDVCAGR